MIDRVVGAPFWQSWGLLIARIIVAGVFGLACFFKFAGMADTAGYIAAAGIPFALPLAWIAAIFELALVIAFLTGAGMRLAALLGIVYVLFLGVTFHGPSHWQANQDEFGFFVDHFTFAAGLLYMLAFGPGPLALRRS
jgi:putative oxidoreductase